MTVRRRLVLIALVAAAPAILGLIYFEVAELRRERRVAELHVLDVAQQAAARRTATLAGAQRFLTIASQVAVLDSDDYRACTTALDGMLKDHPGYVALRVTDPEGAIRCSASLPGHEAVDAVGYAGARAGVVLGPYRSMASDGATADLSIALSGAPASGRRLTATIVIVSNASLSTANQVSRETTVSVFGRDGTVLATYPSHPFAYTKLPAPLMARRIAAIARDGVLDVTGPDGVTRLERTIAVPGAIDTGLFVTAGLDKNVAFANARRRLQNTLLVLGLLASGVFGAVIIGGELAVLRPLRMLTGVVSRIAGGASATPPSPSCGIRNIATGSCSTAVPIPSGCWMMTSGSWR
jgi:hypothetical protein